MFPTALKVLQFDNAGIPVMARPKSGSQGTAEPLAVHDISELGSN
jgi:hypothetical protein